MKIPIGIWLLLGLAGIGFGGEPTVYSIDSDVRLLAKVRMINFGGMGMMGTTSSGEILLRRLVKKDDALKYFMEVYNTGTPEAKVYALAYFHHSAPELFDICWKDTVGKYNPVVLSSVGCFDLEGSFFEQQIRIRLGEYDPFIELALKRSRLSLGGGRLARLTDK